MFCSVIVPTVGRATLSRAVESVLSQWCPEARFELIVVNDSDRPLPDAPWQHAENVTLLHNNRRERCFARNSGAAVARADYLYFLDDDDWLLPGALTVLWQLAQQEPAAAWLHGGIQIVDENGDLLAERNSGLKGRCLAQVMGGAWVPIQASLIAASHFFAVGGYDPSIQGTEDQDLCRRIAMRGTFANTPVPVACLYRGTEWRTSTDYGRATEDTRRSRDALVNEPGAFRLMLASADSSYWYGRVVHIYLSLALWQTHRRQLLTATSRTLHGMLAFFLALPHWPRRDFWRALRDDHVPESLHFIQMAWEQQRADALHRG